MRIPAILAATLLSAAIAAPAAALEQRPMLTQEMAKEMADACFAEAKAQGWRPVIVAVYDAGGNLKHFQRMEGAFLGSIEIAQLKGHTSAVFPRPSRAFGDIAYANPDRPYGIEMVPGLVVFAGGLPIMSADGHHAGGIGVSGATSDQDELCAQAGIDAVADRL